MKTVFFGTLSTLNPISHTISKNRPFPAPLSPQKPDVFFGTSSNIPSGDPCDPNEEHVQTPYGSFPRTKLAKIVAPNVNQMLAPLSPDQTDQRSATSLKDLLAEIKAGTTITPTETRRKILSSAISKLEEREAHHKLGQELLAANLISPDNPELAKSDFTDKQQQLLDQLRTYLAELDESDN